MGETIKVFGYNEVEKALAILLESNYDIKKLEQDCYYGRRHDGIDGENDDKNDPEHFLYVSVVDYGDINIIFPPTKILKMWRFRNRGGGGQSLRVYKASIILMEAIRRDNEEFESKSEAFCGDGEVLSVLNFVLEDSYWIETIEVGKIYERRHDDTDGCYNKSQYLSLIIDSSGNSDVHIFIHPGKYRTLRFRNPFGGGKSERVRKALLIVMEAIRRDNKNNPED